MRFSEIIGQKKIKKELISSVMKDRVSHAQFFLGKNGYGTLPLALAYAQYLNCENQFDDDACGKCNNCVQMNKMEHPDVHFTFPIVTSERQKKSSIYLKDWRLFCAKNKYFNVQDWYSYIKKDEKTGGIYVHEAEDINKSIKLKPYIGKYKIVIIWNAESMNIEISNKLLKNIEEPPSNTLFFLISEKEEKLLTTIKSRTQTIKVNPILNEDLKNKILFEFNEIKNIEDIIKVSEGDYIKSKTYINNSKNNNDFFDEFKLWMRFCVKKDVSSVINWVNSFTNNGREKQKDFINYCLHFFRQSLIKNYNGDELIRIIGEEAKFNANFSNFVHHQNIIKLNDIFNEAFKHIERNGNQKIIFTDLSFQIFKILKKPI